MSSRTLINLVLLVITIIMAAIIWIKPDNSETDKPVRLTELDPADISRIKISNKSGPSAVLERTPTGWGMISPYAIDANTPRIDILLDILSTPSLEQFPLPKKKLDEFGLVDPTAIIELNSTRLEFGSVDPVNYKRYIRIAETLHLTNDIFPHHAMAPAEVYVSHRPIPSSATITGVQTDHWSLVQVDGNWQLSPETPGLSPDLINAKIDSWKNLHATGVEKADGLQTINQVQVSLQGRQKSIRFEIAERNNKLYLVRRDLGIAYRLPPGSNLIDAPTKADQG